MAAAKEEAHNHGSEIKLASDADKHLNDPGTGALTVKQAARAMVEGFQISSPQPTAVEVAKVLEVLGEVDEKGKPKHPFSKAIDAAKAGVAKANELRAKAA